MPENPTLKEVIERLERLIKSAEMANYKMIASLWISEAKVIYNALTEKE